MTPDELEHLAGVSLAAVEGVTVVERYDDGLTLTLRLGEPREPAPIDGPGAAALYALPGVHSRLVHQWVHAGVLDPALDANSTVAWTRYVWTDADVLDARVALALRRAAGAHVASTADLAAALTLWRARRRAPRYVGRREGEAATWDDVEALRRDLGLGVPVLVVDARLVA